MKFTLGLILGGAAVWFFKPQIATAAVWLWRKATPWIKRGEAAAIAEAQKAIK